MPQIEEFYTSYSFRCFGDESILAPLREKLTADYNESLAKWRTVYEQNGEFTMEQLRDMCVTETVYRNLIECGLAYPQKYMQALAEEDHPLYTASCLFEKSGRFGSEMDTKELLDIIANNQEDLGKYGEIDPNAVKLTDHTERMELLDGNLEREYEEYAKDWTGLDFDGMHKKAMDIYTIRQLYNTLRFEKENYPEEQLDIMAQLKKPMTYDIDRIIGERILCEINLSHLDRLFPQMYPDIIPETEIWEISEKPPCSFTIKEGKEAEFRAYKEKNSSDFYTSGILVYAERWGGMMERAIGDGFTVAKAAERTGHEADTDSISDYMYECAVKILSDYWKHGEDLRQWHNSGYEYEGDGVIEPAVFAMQGSDDDHDDTLSQELNM